MKMDKIGAGDGAVESMLDKKSDDEEDGGFKLSI
jgi:twitching motility protein PilU